MSWVVIALVLFSYHTDVYEYLKGSFIDVKTADFYYNYDMLNVHKNRPAL